MSLFDGPLAELNSGCVNLFGDSLVYNPAAAPGFTLIANQTDRNRFAIDPIPSQYAVRWANLADFPTGVKPARGDSFAIGADTFVVVDLRFEEGGGGAYIVGDKQ